MAKEFEVCPECLINISIEEHEMFGGYCEDCYNDLVEEIGELI